MQLYPSRQRLFYKFSRPNPKDTPGTCALPIQQHAKKQKAEPRREIPRPAASQRVRAVSSSVLRDARNHTVDARLC